MSQLYLLSKTNEKYYRYRNQATTHVAVTIGAMMPVANSKMFGSGPIRPPFSSKQITLTCRNCLMVSRRWLSVARVRVWYLTQAMRTVAFQNMLESVPFFTANTSTRPSSSWYIRQLTRTGAKHQEYASHSNQWMNKDESCIQWKCCMC